MKIKDALLLQAFLIATSLNVLFICPDIKGQEISVEDINSDPDYINAVFAEESDPNPLKTPAIKKVGFSFSTGMILLAGGHDNFFTTSYVAPAIAYNISPRFRIRAGCIIFFNSFYKPSFTASQPGSFPAKSLSQTAFFVALDYLLTNRLTLTGSYYKNPENGLFYHGMTSEMTNRYRPGYYMPSESMSLGLNYEITKGFSIGAEFRVSGNYQPALSPYNEPFHPQYNNLYW
ncbi:MAG: hypothetical protein JXK95_09820 [Bacteroidales bacterium]|nr:hypothetical protein [Bacteroidales bacterium]